MSPEDLKKAGLEGSAEVELRPPNTRVKDSFVGFASSLLLTRRR
jgi:hypothetical protein